MISRSRIRSSPPKSRCRSPSFGLCARPICHPPPTVRLAEGKSVCSTVGDGLSVGQRPLVRDSVPSTVRLPRWTPRPQPVQHRQPVSKCWLDAHGGLSCPCLLRRILTGLATGLKQLLEQRAVMDERLTLRLGADVGPLLRQVQGMSGPIVLNNVRVIDRDVGRPPLEIVDRVTAVAHDLGHETIGVADRFRRVVDECSLYRPPLFAYFARASGDSATISSFCRLRWRARSSFSPAR